MALFTQEQKKLVAPRIKSVLKKYGIKGSIAVRDHSTLVVNLWSGDLDLVGNNRGHYQVNHNSIVRIKKEQGSMLQADFYNELITAMKSLGWYDKSNAMSDYFEVSYYLNINVGDWDKQYIHRWGENEQNNRR